MARMRKPKTWAEELADLEDPAPRNFEPENDDDYGRSSDDSEESAKEAEARDHYQDVGKSALRKSDAIDLGPQYSGASISRNAVDEDIWISKSSDDGFESVEEEADDAISGSSNEGSNEGEHGRARDEESAVGMHVTQHSPKADIDSFSGFASEDSDAEDVSTSVPEEEMDASMEDSDASSSSSMSSPPSQPEDERVALRRMMAEEQGTVAASLISTARSDIEKGRAIKRQRMAFDSLLNTRIKLQKALVSSNTSTADSLSNSSEHNNTIRAAETAALHLWNNLDSLRSSLAPTNTNKIPAHSNLAAATTLSSALWSTMQSHESHRLPRRRVVLTKWSQRTAPIAPVSRTKFSQAPSQQPLTAVLDQQLSGPNLTHHISRTRTPRSCAPLQASQQLESSDEIYDDADFYSLLLRELVDQRMATPNSTNNGIVLPSNRDLKVRKQVDRKASKGRKMRYNVHERLQNFMAPEDRGTWGERQRAELFASLLGKKPEVDDEGKLPAMEDGEDETDFYVEEGGLRLFG